MRAKREEHYCAFCGSKMKNFLVPATEYEIYGEWGGFTPYGYDTFCKKTGKRQFVNKYVCPNKPTGFISKYFNSHHEFIDEDIITGKV